MKNHMKNHIKTKVKQVWNGSDTGYVGYVEGCGGSYEAREVRATFQEALLDAIELKESHEYTRATLQ